MLQNNMTKSKMPVAGTSFKFQTTFVSGTEALYPLMSKA